MVAPLPAETKANQGIWIVHEDPAELLGHLGVLSEDPQKARLELNGKKPRPSFEWVNFATTDIPIGKVSNTIISSGLVNPPRTAHIGGSWENIVRGGGASVALNQVVRQEGVGYPLIYDLNQTPTSDMKAGDTLYFPGVVFKDDSPIKLQLYTVDGEQVDQNRPRFSPLMLSKNPDNRVIVPLTQIHRQEMSRLGIDDALFISDLVVQKREAVTQIFRTLLNQIAKEDDDFFRRQFLKLIIDRGVRKDGLVNDQRTLWNRDGLTLGSQHYKDQEEFIAAILKPIEVASDPNIHLNSSLPDVMPLLSKEMLIVLMAVMNTDFYQGHSSLKPINPHLHWGAFQMAGAPPKYDGYFSGSVSGIRTIMTILRAGNPDIPTVYYCLLPAAPFDLWASIDDPQGQSAIESLLKLVQDYTDKYKGKPNKIAKGVEQAVVEWLNPDELPDYLISRFSGFDTPLTPILPPSPQMVKPQGFDTLTFRQVSMLIGELKERLNNY